MASEKDLRTRRKRLFFDIEVSPNFGWFWTCGFKVVLSPENIIKERAVICIAWKWEGDKQIHELRWDKKQCDKKMLTEFAKIISDADEAIGHNGDRFDLPWLRTRCLMHRIQLTPHIKTIDTLKLAKSKFRFNSNRLAYISKFIGVQSKIKTEISMWLKICLDKDPVQLEKMVKYCKRDVKVLEDVFTQFRPYVTPQTHYGVIFGEDRGTCPECGAGSESLIKQRIKVTLSGMQKQQYKCKECGTYHEKTIKNDPIKR